MSKEKEELKYHEAANIFPLIEGDAFSELVDDIRKNGQRETIKLVNEMIIDGRNRYLACVACGIEPKLESVNPVDPVAYVLSLNLHRRHLTTGQRADVGAKIATMRHGNVKAQKSDGPKGPSSIDEAASQMNVSARSVKRAKKVHAKGSESTKKALSDGSLPVTTAAAFVDAVPDKAEQEAIVAKGPAAVKEVVKASAKRDDTEDKAAAAVPRRVSAGAGAEYAQHSSRSGACGSNVKYAESAIMQLERILPEHEWEEAFDLVSDWMEVWIKKQEKGKGKKRKVEWVHENDKLVHYAIRKLEKINPRSGWVKSFQELKLWITQKEEELNKTPD